MPTQSFFLFGPRGTGKSTWLKNQYKPDLNIDLLKSETYLELSTTPEKLRDYVSALPKNSKVVIDEIQRIPELLNEVHSLIFEYTDKYQFALTGSSARKLKKENANMLAGRAINKQFFTLASIELDQEFSLEKSLQFGSLPRTVNLKTIDDKIDYLTSYVDTYLKEEIQQEALVRNLQNYNRFLRHAAEVNGQVINLNNISREAAIPRATLDGYFSILKDTMLGDFIEPIHLHAKVKEVSTPKFYFFDCGVVRALRQELRQPVGEERGFLFETFILNELRMCSSYNSKGWEICYWGVPSGNEVDFILCQGKQRIGIEVKATKTWKNQFSKGLTTLLDAKKVRASYGVYLGKEKMKSDGVNILPVNAFLEKLWQGNLFD